MKTSRYCPKCHSFSLRRTKRGFIRKVLLNLSPTYQCRECDYRFTSHTMHKNPPIDDPSAIFFEKGHIA